MIMPFSNVRPCPDNRPVVELLVCFRFGNERNPWPVFAPGDFFERDAAERAIVLDESLAEWAEDQGYAPEHCTWELLTELPEGLEEADLPGWGESYAGNGKYGYQGR